MVTLPGRGGGSGQQQPLELLPSERDRKATLGCLAAVLNILRAARWRNFAPVAPPKVQLQDGSTKGGGEGGTASEAVEAEVTEGECAVEDQPSFSIHDEDKAENDSGLLWSRSARRKVREARRTRAFQRELLNVSAELLFLTSEHADAFVPNLDIQCDDEETERELLLEPFLQELSGAEETFRCVALLVFRFLLVSGEEKPKGTKRAGSSDSNGSSALEEMTIVGYDARVRHTFKYLAVALLSHWDLKEHGFMTPEAATARATRKFEALEDGIASRMSTLSQIMQENEKGKASLSGQKKQSTATQNVVRGLKIGAAGVAAGTLFAITGGIAAPAIVGGISALVGASSTVYVVATVLLLPAATTIFGVGGGTIVANKMSKRTAGLTEFDIEKNNDSSAVSVDQELSRTVCISGWLRDELDFERPFGMAPRDLKDRHELLCRYCSVYASHVMPYCEDILEQFHSRREVEELWRMLKAYYGRDPNSLLPLEAGPRREELLSGREDAEVDELMRAMGLPLPTTKKAEKGKVKNNTREDSIAEGPLLDRLASFDIDLEPRKEKKMSDFATRSYNAWDFHATYGGELYVVKWETQLLREMHGAARDFQKDVAKTAAEQVLKKTAVATLMSAIALPAALLAFSNIIDEKWTLTAERSDEAGVLLASSLLNSDAGHRPVSLVGFSFGARVIVACMKELARHQDIWEQQREEEKTAEMESSVNQSRGASLKKSLANMSLRQRGSNSSYSREPASIVEDVILMGCPASMSSSTWQLCRDVIGGRIINCHSQNDMMLALMYRLKNVSSIMSPPAGIRAVDVPGVESYNVADLVASHGEYAVAVREILQRVGYGQPCCIGGRVGADESETK